MMWLPSPGKEIAQTHECLAHLPWSITINDTVKFTGTGVYFGKVSAQKVRLLDSLSGT